MKKVVNVGDKANLWVTDKGKDEDDEDNEEGSNVDDRANLGVVSKDKDEGSNSDEDKALKSLELTVERSNIVDDNTNFEIVCRANIVKNEVTVEIEMLLMIRKILKLPGWHIL